ncbi:hypothetical protein K491DRAFT_681648 [Lophiostoma macrostomum CBS 122681]|uniref:Probable double zinc ribbon domain-containing protein n=1 Tax=Lophiostoma macrostomum CBS 122681 TaxID=1314788 RepID=A0A6A6SWE7_9PLEO|nr:hypothetical protein K491DRAFT_681648 [Lophiostoma macrostomum CBS 122681]
MSILKDLFAISGSKSTVDPQYASTPLAELDNPFRSANVHGHWHCHNCGDLWHPLKYNRSLHPFSKLKCTACNWSWQPDWEMTKTARPFKSTAKDPIPVPILDNELKEQVPYFTVCECGLTWRAKNLTSWWKKSSGFKKAAMSRPGADTGVLPKQSYIGFEYIKCECGAVHEASWKRFSIRKDPLYTAGNGEYLYIPDGSE